MKVKKGESRNEKRKIEIEKVREGKGRSHRIRKTNGADCGRKHDRFLKHCQRHNGPRVLPL